MQIHIRSVSDRTRATAHKLHWVSHAGYLVAATAEGHLYYSTMAAVLLFFTIGCAVIGAHEE